MCKIDWLQARTPPIQYQLDIDLRDQTDLKVSKDEF